MSEYFGDIVDELKAISPQEPVVIIYAIPLDTGATGATCKRSYSLARPVNTWLRFSMTQKWYIYIRI